MPFQRGSVFHANSKFNECPLPLAFPLPLPLIVFLLLFAATDVAFLLTSVDTLRSRRENLRIPIKSIERCFASRAAAGSARRAPRLRCREPSQCEFFDQFVERDTVPVGHRGKADAGSGFARRDAANLAVS